MKPTLYEILGVSQDVTPGDLKRAYHQAARKYHPDATGGDVGREDWLKAINAAYDLLSDPVRRQYYDAELAANNPPPGDAPPGDVPPQNEAGAGLGQAARLAAREAGRRVLDHAVGEGTDLAGKAAKLGLEIVARRIRRRFGLRG